MKLETLITKCVRANPTRYASTSWEVMRWRVLDHLYIHTQVGFRWSRGRLISMFPDPALDAAPGRPPLPLGQAVLVNYVPLRVAQTALQFSSLPGAASEYTPAPLAAMSPLMHIPDDVEPDYYRGASELCAVMECYFYRNGCRPEQRRLLDEIYAKNGWEP